MVMASPSARRRRGSSTSTSSSSSSSDGVDDRGAEQPPAEDPASNPPLPDEVAPPLPDGGLASATDGDDGWVPVWDAGRQAYYFFNRISQVTQWDNPRVPTASDGPPPGLANHERNGAASPPISEPELAPELELEPKTRPHGGYNPAIHGDYDPTADYAIEAQGQPDGERSGATSSLTTGDPATLYATTGAFNRFTGRWQAEELTPENFNDENKSKRQMTAYFDVDAAANSHNGRSLRAERARKRLSKKEVKAFKDKRREKKEEKRRAWLRD